LEDALPKAREDGARKRELAEVEDVAEKETMAGEEASVAGFGVMLMLDTKSFRSITVHYFSRFHCCVCSSISI